MNHPQTPRVKTSIHDFAVRAQLTLNSYTDFENFYDFKPTSQHEQTLNRVLDQVISWGTALKPVHQ